MSWEDILKRGRVPPKKPTKEEKPDTSWKNKVPKKEDWWDIELPPEPENVVERIKQETEREAIIQDLTSRDEERRSRKPRYSEPDEERKKRQESNKRKERWAESDRIKAEKRKGTYRPQKGQKKNRNPQTPKKTRSQRKAASAAKKRRAANQARYSREDAAKKRRDERRGL